MPLILSNKPSIALAQEWVNKLDAWLDVNGTVGYDPFDIKAHPLVQRMQENRFARKCSTAVSDMFPLAARRMLQIPKADNPKTHALLAIGQLRLFQLTQDAARLDLALAHLDWLRQHAVPGFSGLCWGYPFPVKGQGVNTPANTPVVVISAIAGEAFALANAVTGKKEHLDSVASIALFILKDIPRIPGTNDRLCFTYTPSDLRRVHNANLLAAEHLARAAVLSGMDECRTPISSALSFTLSAQREDGAWPYGEWSEGEPFESQLMRIVDHHHTGFVLRSLHTIETLIPGTVPAEHIEKGFRFYRKKLLSASGMPLTEHGRYPVDIHACAEAILCPSVLSDRCAGCQEIALRSMRWTHNRLRDRNTGAPWYRLYPMYTAHIVFPRWGAAWIYRALAEYLHHFRA